MSRGATGKGDFCDVLREAAGGGVGEGVGGAPLATVPGVWGKAPDRTLGVALMACRDARLLGRDVRSKRVAMERPREPGTRNRGQFGEEKRPGAWLQAGRRLIKTRTSSLGAPGGYSDKGAGWRVRAKCKRTGSPALSTNPLSSQKFHSAAGAASWFFRHVSNARRRFAEQQKAPV